MAASGELKRGLILPNWIAGADVGLLVEYGVAAEEAGWDGLFLADHLFFPPPPARNHATLDAASDWSPSNFLDFPDPWITLTGIAVRTTRIRLGSWVTPIPRRQPWQVARDLATLDRLSGGRLILGTGLGRRSEYERFGIPWEPKTLAKKYDEALEIIAGFWSGNRLSFTGEHFTVNDVAVLPTPVQLPRIPIVVGGIWPNTRPIQRGARWDGIMPHYPGDGIVPAAGDVVPEAILEEMLSYYHSLTDDPGEVFLPATPPNHSPNYADVCKRLGVTWLYTSMRGEAGEWVLDMQRVREGPPR